MESQHLYKCMRSDCGREVHESMLDESLRICSCPAISHLVLTEGRYGVLCADWCRKCKVKLPCDNIRHISCFESLLPREADETQHQPKSARGLRDDAKIKSHLSEIFSTETDIAVQRRLHEEDNRVARWFIAESTEADPRRGVLYVTDRFQRLSAQGKLAENQFPSIVSFIGDTGKGKSTIIRAMIKTSTRTVTLSFNPDDLSIHDLRLNSLETPVTAIQHPKFNLTPTSAGIHLYADPQTLSEQSPILFADCEGFNTHTTAQAVASTDLNRSHDDIPFRRKWTIERGEHKRESITDGLYPQFMYLFSDVICYVMDGSASVSKDIIRLLEWAARGEADSVNMEPYKALVVVINQPSNWQREWESPEFSARDSMLDQLPEKGWRESSLLIDAVKRINSTRDGNRISTTLALVKKYFQRIEVCYIPRQRDRGVSAELMLFKYRLLRQTILSCSKEAQTKKKETYNRFNFIDLSSQFDLAFHHFATSDGPFDMYKIARKGRVEPRKMSDHILVLMKCMEEMGNLQSTQLFSEIVASSFINTALRDRQRALPPQHTFESEEFHFLETCSRGISEFYRSHKCCEFVDNDEYCIIKYEHHHEGHKSMKKGIGKGHFLPEDISTCIDLALKDIRDKFIEFHDQLCLRDGIAKRPEDEGLIRAQRLSILANPGTKEFWRNCRSYKTCFTCLRSVPHHVLPCGHSFCGTCVVDFATPSRTVHSAYDITECFLCNASFKETQIIRTIPPCAGIRILTLDGGGVRGIIELVILKHLIEITGLGINIGHFFDLIVGTSTGGIIALGLVLRGLSLDEMFEEFQDICENTFSGPLEQTVKKIGFAFNWYDSLYSTEYLKHRVRNILSVDGKDLSMFGSPIQTGKQPITRVGVTTVKKGETPSTIANYNRTAPELLPDFEREETEAQDLTAWEAALCTSAAPVYFSRYTKQSPNQDFYIDGGVKNNNPVNWALNEAKQIWPEWKLTQRTDILLSLGTGKFENYTLLEPSLVFNRSWVRDIIRSFLQNLNGEVVWEEFKQGKGAEKYDAETHHRLNANLPLKRCKLDDVRQLKVLREETERYFDRTNSRGGYRYLHSVAHRLLAKLFFFQPTSPVWRDKGKGASLIQLPGVIRCRLDNYSTELKTLVTKIASFFSSNQDSLSDAVNENNKLPFTEDTVRAVRGRGSVFEVQHIITTSNKKSWQAVYVRFKEDDDYYPISGFPCRMEDLLSAAGEDKDDRTEVTYSAQEVKRSAKGRNKHTNQWQGAEFQNPKANLSRSSERDSRRAGGSQHPFHATLGEQNPGEQNYPRIELDGSNIGSSSSRNQTPRPFTYSSTTIEEIERRKKGLRSLHENEERVPRRLR